MLGGGARGRGSSHTVRAASVSFINCLRGLMYTNNDSVVQPTAVCEWTVDDVRFSAACANERTVVAHGVFVFVSFAVSLFIDVRFRNSRRC